MRTQTELSTKLDAFRFRKFGFRGDRCLWHRFLKAAHAAQPESKEELLELVNAVYEEETGKTLKVHSKNTGDLLLKKCDSSKHRCVSGISEGVVARLFWINEVPEAISQIFDSLEKRE
jgi:hypothetical protein